MNKKRVLIKLDQLIIERVLVADYLVCMLDNLSLDPFFKVYFKKFPPYFFISINDFLFTKNSKNRKTYKSKKIFYHNT